MIDKLYKKYFQKSKSFLYPALGIKKKGYPAPIETYVSVEGLIGVEDVKLICYFKNSTSVQFKNFEESMLLGNPLYESRIDIGDYTAYVFSMEIYEDDFFRVLLGKYSKLSTQMKKNIKQYFGEHSAEYSYIETYLYPEKFYETYSELLDIDVSALKSVRELCDPLDLEKENLKISKEIIENLKENI
jgi:hypothetical protein